MIASNIHITIWAEKADEKTNAENLRKRQDIHREIGIPYAKPKTNDDWFLFYEAYELPSSKYDKIKAIVEKYNTGLKTPHLIDMDYLREYEDYGEITLGSQARISDPCYQIDTWCAGTINVLAGKYRCFYQKNSEGRVAVLKIVHKDYDADLAIDEELGIDVGVDSGCCGIYDLEMFKEMASNKTYYDICCNMTDAVTPDDRAFITSSGFGDGGYTAYVARNENGEIIAVRIPFIEYGTDLT